MFNKIICWLIGHDFKIGKNIAIVMCQRCGIVGMGDLDGIYDGN